MGRSVTTSTESAFVTVPTSIGFTAGDLVYNQTGGYGRVPDTAVATGTFSVGDTGLPIAAAAGTPGQAQTYFEEYAGTSDYTNGTAALLTNGNIVIPYSLNNTVANGTYPYFRIVNSSGTTVVAQTQVDTTNKSFPANIPVVGAVALPNGNFAVYWRYFDAGSSLSRLAFRIYNSSGVSQTAVILDTTVAFYGTGYDIHAVARSDSSFVVVGQTSAQPFYRVYNGSTGATVYSGLWGSNQITATAGCLSVVVRSDNSWVMAQLGSASTVWWEVRSATNVQSAASSYTVGTTSSIAAVCMANDVVRVLTMWSSANVYVNTLTGTTMSSYTVLANTGGTNVGFLSAYTFDSGTKLIVMAGSTANFRYNPSYAVFNSSMTRISPGTAFIRAGGYTSYPVATSFIEVGDNIRVYRSTRPNLGVGTTSVLSGAGIAYTAISKTTYLPANLQSVGYVVGTASGVAASGYVRASSTPTTASFYAASTTGQSTSLAVDTFLITPRVVETVSCNSTQVFSKADGGFYYLYKYTNSPFTIKLAVYDKTGTQQSILTVDTGDSPANGARMTVLSNGKIAVIYKKGTALLCKIYSSALAVLASTQIAATIVASDNFAGNAVISSMGNAGRFVVGYTNSTGTIYAVCDDTGAVINTGTVLANANARTPAVCGSKTDGFMYYCANGSINTHAVYMYNPTGASTYGLLSTLAGPNGSPSYPINGLHLEASVDNCLPLLTGVGTGFSAQIAGGIDGGTLYVTAAMFNSYSNFNGETSSGGCMGVGFTGLNGLVMVSADYNTGGNRMYCWAGPPQLTTTTYQYRAASALPVEIDCYSYSSPTIAPFVGDTCLIAYTTSAGIPSVCAIAPYASTQFATVIGGEAVSSPITLSPANRFVLVGVAATTAAAGSTGIVQTKGSAQVSSFYPSGTAFQPFDFRNQTTFGVAGTINGRNLTLEQ